ncbi:Citrate synthase (si) [Klebsiella pneumoniae]|nr:Citrate synthase (si) [Klebsiella pneumoniae]
MRGLNQSGFCSYDPGFANTAGCQSAISWIDTENSVLLHRGYPVDQLARQCDFLEVAYIMLNGDAPDEASYQTFRETITRHTLVHEQIARMCSGFRRDSHPMALMCALVGALAAFYHDVLDVENPQHRTLAATRLLSKMPTIAAMSYKYTIEQPAAYPRNDLSYAGNFLQMLFAIPAEKIRSQSGYRAGDEPDLGAACRSRAVRLDHYGARGGLLRGEFIRLRRRRAGVAVGADAWRSK